MDQAMLVSNRSSQNVVDGVPRSGMSKALDQSAFIDVRHERPIQPNSRPMTQPGPPSQYYPPGSYQGYQQPLSGSYQAPYQRQDVYMQGPPQADYYGRVPNVAPPRMRNNYAGYGGSQSRRGSLASNSSSSVNKFFKRGMKFGKGDDDDDGMGEGDADVEVDTSTESVSFDDLKHIRGGGRYGNGSSSLDTQPYIPTLSNKPKGPNGQLSNVQYRKQMTHQKKMMASQAANMGKGPPRAMSMQSAGPGPGYPTGRMGYDPRAMSMQSRPPQFNQYPGYDMSNAPPPKAMSMTSRYSASGFRPGQQNFAPQPMSYGGQPQMAPMQQPYPARPGYVPQQPVSYPQQIRQTQQVPPSQPFQPIPQAQIQAQPDQQIQSLPYVQSQQARSVGPLKPEPSTRDPISENGGVTEPQVEAAVQPPSPVKSESSVITEPFQPINSSKGRLNKYVFADSDDEQDDEPVREMNASREEDYEEEEAQIQQPQAEVAEQEKFVTPQEPETLERKLEPTDIPAEEDLSKSAETLHGTQERFSPAKSVASTSTRRQTEPDEQSTRQSSYYSEQVRMPSGSEPASSMYSVTSSHESNEKPRVASAQIYQLAHESTTQQDVFTTATELPIDEEDGGFEEPRTANRFEQYESSKNNSNSTLQAFEAPHSVTDQCDSFSFDSISKTPQHSVIENGEIEREVAGDHTNNSSISDKVESFVPETKQSPQSKRTSQGQPPSHISRDDSYLETYQAYGYGDLSSIHSKSSEIEKVPVNRSLDEQQPKNEEPASSNLANEVPPPTGTASKATQAPAQVQGPRPYRSMLFADDVKNDSNKPSNASHQSSFASLKARSRKPPPKPLPIEKEEDIGPQKKSPFLGFKEAFSKPVSASGSPKLPNAKHFLKKISRKKREEEEPISAPAQPDVSYKVIGASAKSAQNSGYAHNYHGLTINLPPQDPSSPMKNKKLPKTPITPSDSLMNYRLTLNLANEENDYRLSRIVDMDIDENAFAQNSSIDGMNGNDTSIDSDKATPLANSSTTLDSKEDIHTKSLPVTQNQESSKLVNSHLSTPPRTKNDEDFDFVSPESRKSAKHSSQEYPEIASYPYLINKIYDSQHKGTDSALPTSNGRKSPETLSYRNGFDEPVKEEREIKKVPAEKEVRPFSTRSNDKLPPVPVSETKSVESKAMDNASALEPEANSTFLSEFNAKPVSPEKKSAVLLAPASRSVSPEKRPVDYPSQSTSAGSSTVGTRSDRSLNGGLAPQSHQGSKGLTDSVPNAQITPVFTPTQLGLFNSNQELFNELQIVSGELAGSISREIKLQHKLGSHNIPLETEGVDEQSKIDKLVEQLADERRKRFAVEEFLAQQYNKGFDIEDLKNRVYNNSDMRHQIFQLTEEKNLSKSKFEILEQEHSELKSKLEKALSENKELTSKTIPQLKNQLQVMENSVSASHNESLLNELKQLKIEKNRLKSQLETKSNVVELESHKQELQEALKNVKAQKEMDLKMSAERIRSLESKVERLTLANGQFSQKTAEVSEE
ncbi:hypothetical protein OGAPHI_004114 [Ogataea philodendri]|uniref:Uncharacterized protein n=1 Tax=Ogataea philodendri TaxID=1378263 RepID=A0A9P8P642_9ASCO|nr:uncharacterized protein OGAPHI_004114 [Ogataea philodendri]KAH3665925.1 hypothetical protein OGAPHI_004114 [Ogataea philodendri]